ncbi:MAG: hypothetical protein V4590_02055 [Bacteroidota bacterium]
MNKSFLLIVTLLIILAVSFVSCKKNTPEKPVEEFKRYIVVKLGTHVDTAFFHDINRYTKPHCMKNFVDTFNHEFSYSLAIRDTGRLSIIFKKPIATGTYSISYLSMKPDNYHFYYSITDSSRIKTLFVYLVASGILTISNIEPCEINLVNYQSHYAITGVWQGNLQDNSTLKIVSGSIIFHNYPLDNL